MPALTASLGRYIADLNLEDIPGHAQTIAKTGITDCVGVMIAGARDPVVALLDRELASSDGAALASLIPSGKKRNIEDAALINGAAAHVLDYDDVTLDGHPSAVLVPAIMAQGEHCGASGSELLTAYVIGYEIWAELLTREPVPLHRKGWHPTAVRGTIAAAAACAKLRGLSAERCQAALAIAGSMAGGLMANFGSLTKCFQVGRAAQSGVVAARLAEAGLTASPDALEHQSGFLAAFSPCGEPDLERDFDLRNRTWHLTGQGLNLKRYPICYATHRAIDAAIDLSTRHDIKPMDVAHVEVSTGEMQMLMLRNDRPKTAFEAKFSMQFAMASALVARNVGLPQLTDQFVHHPEVQALIPRVSATTTTETMNGSAFAPSDSVEVTMVDGQIFASGPVAHAKGSMQRPLARNEMRDKFTECVGDDLAPPGKTDLFDKLMNIEHLNGVTDMFSLQ
jgi:2-methylcitrate dehydratase PrpD